ncbi:MAG: energy-coupling factor ABC transporter ATP-binding protein, partial [Gemmatimonadales bacterium]
MVRWEGVSHDYGRGDVLHDVTLTVQPGECVALLGPNGAGKTTLTRMLMGLVRPRAGRVSVGDWDVASRRPDQMAALVGYAFQHADQQLFARTVRDDVAFGPGRLGMGAAGVDDVLAELELVAVASRHPYDLPAPVRKLVTLAGVLAMQPAVLVLDEPTAGFDGGLRARVIAAIATRVARGTTVIAVSHDLAFVRAALRRLVTLEQGRIVDDA